MKSRVFLRAAVVAEWLLIALGLVCSFALEGYLPPPLQDYLRWQENQDVSLSELIALAGLIPMLLAYLVASVGLFFFQNWARWLYLGTTVLSYGAYPFLGPTVEHGLADAVDEVSVLVSGVIIGVAFFGNAIPSTRKQAELADNEN